MILFYFFFIYQARSTSDNRPKNYLAFMVTSYWKSLKTVKKNLAENPNLTLVTYLKSGKLFFFSFSILDVIKIFKFSKKNSFNIFGCNFDPKSSPYRLLTSPGIWEPGRLKYQHLKSNSYIPWKEYNERTGLWSLRSETPCCSQTNPFDGQFNFITLTCCSTIVPMTHV